MVNNVNIFFIKYSLATERKRTKCRFLFRKILLSFQVSSRSFNAFNFYLVKDINRANAKSPNSNPIHDLIINCIIRPLFAEAFCTYLSHYYCIFYLINNYVKLYIIFFTLLTQDLFHWNILMRKWYSSSKDNIYFLRPWALNP